MQQTWIDGFNLFYRWSRTKDHFHPQGGGDILYGQREGLRLLSEALGGKRKITTVFMDGGLNRSGMSAHGMRVEYAGPGAKADHLMLEMMRYRSVAGGRVCVVTSDRTLAGNLRAFGAKIVSVEDFLQSVCKNENKSGGAGGRKRQAGSRAAQREEVKRRADAEPSRDVNLSSREVEIWLRFFEDEE